MNAFYQNMYSLYLDNHALDNSSFLLIVQNLVSPEQNGLSHSNCVSLLIVQDILDNRSISSKICIF